MIIVAKLYEIKCLYCGETKVTPYPRTLYCNLECQRKHRNERRIKHGENGVCLCGCGCVFEKKPKHKVFLNRSHKVAFSNAKAKQRRISGKEKRQISNTSQ